MPTPNQLPTTNDGIRNTEYGLRITALPLLILLYLLATLPYLADFPLVETAQMGIAAPAYKLATQGIYGNDLYRGLYHAESRNYEYLPLYPLAVALSFKLLGLGVWQARLVSVWCGLLVLMLTYRLGKTAVNTPVGLLAATALCLLAITVPGATTDLYPGRIPLLDFARVLRYDIMAPLWLLAASHLFLLHSQFTIHNSPFTITHLIIGFLIGLATLSHLYGAFILPVFGVLLIWQAGWRAWRPFLLIIAGWSLTLLPWLIYILQDLPAYQGQMLRHENRFDLLNPVFYVNNLRGEIWRYVKFIGRFRPPVLFPRPGFWLMAVAVIAAYIHLWPQIRRPHLSARFLFITLPMLATLLALLVSFKRYSYVALLLPFLAILVGLGIVVIWNWLRGRGRWWRLLFGLWLLVAVAEGLFSVAETRQTAATITPYRELTAVLHQHISPNSRPLALHTYWLALADYDVAALDLAYNLTDPAFVGHDARPLPQVIHTLAPDYIIVPQEALKAYQTNPQALPGEQVINFWRTLDSIIQTDCPDEVMRMTTDGYGVVTVYRCS